MLRRRRPLMRAAMIGGAGYYAGKKVSEGRADDQYQDDRITQLEQQQAAAAQQPAAPAKTGITDDTIEQLRKLGELHEQGILTDDEFQQQKQSMLRSM